ncbi:VanZ family protein [Polynucleobacter sp. UB-Raua-W9]|jgi:VanZ family protein|uniref:VanZ family protein n=1 Tax=Polynucleobacter sp. UB-Raua-W9 TaxID=1819736 RepID=UPI001BFD432A|nr:VanZ family protein [Polynucleobacter sp. UB-Raua-W9]QWD72316.1 VanZ family protein [Polynucleobacter sp. UB-Raua-W9]
MDQKDQRPHKFAWPLQAMPLARAMSLSYALLIVYVSLNPFDFDFGNGIDASAWVGAPLPRFITLFDVSVNILAYIPFGFLLVFAAYPRWRNFVALSIALVLSALLALSVETLQSWLPTRIPSLMDWWANMFGGLLGGLLAIPLGPQWLSGSVIRRRFDQWFGLNWAACALFLLFPWSQIYPQSSWLGTGVWGHAIFGSIDWGTLVINQVVQETLITALCWLGVALLLSSGLRTKAPQWRILNGLLCITVVMKTFFTALQFGGEFSLIWLTAGALWGMVLASFLLRGALRLNQRGRLILALFCLVSATIAIHVLPDNPYFILNLRHWHQGRLLHFNELMQWVSVVWLPIALIWMIYNAAELKPKH